MVGLNSLSSGTVSKLSRGQAAATGLALTPGLQSNTSLASSSRPSKSSGTEIATLATSPLRSTTLLSSQPQSSSPISSAAPLTQIGLGPMLRNVLLAGQSLSAEISIPASKTKFISSIESTEPLLQQKFDSMGGVDIASTRCSQPGGGILGGMLQLVGCAFNSLEHLKAGVDAPPHGNEPDFPSINQDLIHLGEVSNQIAEEEGQSNENRPSISTGDSDPSKSATSKTSSSTSTVTGASLSSSPTSSLTSSPTSLSSTSSMSSSKSNNSSEILGYRTPIVGYPGPPLSLDAAADGIFEVIGSVLMSAYNTSSLLSLTLPYDRLTTHAPSDSMVSALIHEYDGLCPSLTRYHTSSSTQESRSSN